MLRRFATATLTTVTVTLALGAAACGSSSSAVKNDSPEGNPEPAAVQADPAAWCVATFTRMHECTEEYIPSLVDTRIELDLPAGIAAEGATPEGRAALIATAKQEWAVDGVEPARTQNCQKIAAGMSEQQRAQAVSQAETCLAEASCGDFVACIAPFQREQLSAAKAKASQGGW